jgi:RND superfamily putative drug exporter
MCAALTAVVAARTLVPALLKRWGPRLRPVRASRTEHGFGRLAETVESRPWATVGVSLGILVVLAAPVFGPHLSELGVNSLPSSSESRLALVALDARFPSQGAAAIDVVAPIDAPTRTAKELSRIVARLDGVRAVATAPLGPDTLLVADIDGAGNGPLALRAVHTMREAHLPYKLLVGGGAAFQIDHQHELAERLPLALVLLALATVILIGMLTGSWALALLAPFLAALSQAAMLGALVWAYQQGHLHQLLPMASTGTTIVYVPIVAVAVAVAVAYALSLDYFVFLISRIQEARRSGLAHGAAITEGVARTGPVITTAAGLMALVFVGFASGSLLLVEQLGFALAVAVVLDTTVVRCLLVPAVLTLIGHRFGHPDSAID